MLVTTYLKPYQHGDHFLVHGLRGAAALIDPFIAVDHVWIRDPIFPMHRHAGMSAVSYLFPDAETGIDYRDSRGGHRLIRPGALHWTMAGAGIDIDEQVAESGKTLHALQFFVDLAPARRTMAPFTLSLNPEDVPCVVSDGAIVRVPLGKFGNTRSPLRPPADVTMLDISLQPGASITVTIVSGTRAFFLPVRGDFSVDRQSFSASEFRMPVYLVQAPARRVIVRALAREGARVAFFTGSPMPACVRGAG